MMNLIKFEHVQYMCLWYKLESTLCLGFGILQAGVGCCTGVQVQVAIGQLRVDVVEEVQVVGEVTGGPISVGVSRPAPVGQGGQGGGQEGEGWVEVGAGVVVGVGSSLPGSKKAGKSVSIN